MVADNDIEIYSTHNKGKFVVAEKFVKTLENKIYKYMTVISKKVYIDKLVENDNDTVENAIIHIIKTYFKYILSLDVKTNTYIDFDVEANDEYPKFKVYDHVRISKYQKKFFIKKVINTVPQTCVIENLNGEQIVGTLYEKELKKQTKQSLKRKKELRKQMINCMLSQVVTICLIKKMSTNKMSYYPEPGTDIRNETKVELNLSNYAVKFDIEKATGVDILKLAKKADLASLQTKTNIDKLDTDKLKTVPGNLNNLESKVNEMYIDKLKTVPGELKKLSNVVDKYVFKQADYDTKVKEIEDKIVDPGGLVKKTGYDTRI